MINITSLLRTMLAYRVEETRRWATNSEEVQRQQLAWLVSQARHTHWGETYHFNEISSYEDFAQKVMCQHYIISYGDNTELIKNFCKIVGIEMI